MLLTSVISCTPQPKIDTIIINVTVLADKPVPPYILLAGMPVSIGVYEFYLTRPDLPGSGTFKEIDVIRLERINDKEFKGSKAINKIKGTLCIGYPSTNYIDEKTCVQISQAEKEANTSVHYWKTTLAVQ